MSISRLSICDLSRITCLFFYPKTSPMKPNPSFISAIYKLMQHIHLYAHELLPFALIYISRFQKWSKANRSPSSLKAAIPSSIYQMAKPLTPFHLLVIALVLAQKYHDDQRWSNRTWSTFLGMPLTEINAIELFFLNALDHQLFVPESQHLRMLVCMQGIMKRNHSSTTTLLTAQPPSIQSPQSHGSTAPQQQSTRQILTPPISPVHRFNRKRSIGTSMALQDITANNIPFQSSSDVFPMFIQDQGIVFQDTMFRSPSPAPNYFPEFHPNASVMVPPAIISNRSQASYPISQLVPLEAYYQEHCDRLPLSQIMTYTHLNRPVISRKSQISITKPELKPNILFNFTQFLENQSDACSTAPLKKPRLQL